MVSSSFFVAVLLSLVLTKTASSKKLLSPKESIECPTLCDDIKLDAVTPINHLSPKILVVSGSCAWIVDTKSSNRNHIKHGFKHSFTFSQIQDMVSIRNSSNIEFVSIYVSLLLIKFNLIIFKNALSKRIKDYINPYSLFLILNIF